MTTIAIVRALARLAIVAGIGSAAGVLAQPVEERYKNPSNWLSYDRDNTGQRYSELSQINRENVSKLVPKWVFQFSQLQLRTESTPLVRDGVMYLTAGGVRAFALDATTGTRIWRFDYPYRQGEGRQDPNWSRGFGISGNRLLMGTPDCQMIALDSRSGAMLWRSPITADQP